MRSRAAVFAAIIAMAPLTARAADLVVWWEEGWYPQEDEALTKVVAAFEQGSGKEVEIAFYPIDELPDKIEAALAAGEPPDVAFGGWLPERAGPWAFEDRLVDLSDAVGSFSNLFDPGALDRVTLLNARTGQKALYGLPVGRSTNHLHVWKSLLERAGFSLDDIPKEWEPFWLFWCDQVQPAVREALGRDDIWGIGLPMSDNSDDTIVQLDQFLAAYAANYVSRAGALVIDDPEIRRGLIKVMESYTEIYRKGCTPPDSVTWGDRGNNDSFLAQAVVMTPNETLSIPNALRGDRPDDYHENTATIEWPVGPRGAPFPIFGTVFPLVLFKDGGHVAAAEEFVRFLVREGWLAHYLDWSAERFMPAMPALLNQPFWLDPSDGHRMASVMQASSRPLLHGYAQASGNWRHDVAWQEKVWAKAVHRVAAEGISPEQAVDEAIARIKQILAE
jgi:multiple sugar transport system substrate-binding protein